ncbi:MAG: MFS transporter [Desulfuromonadaceae bacterium]
MLRKFSFKITAALRDLGGQVIALFIVIFLADVVFGFFVSSFSIYARHAGMTLLLLGVVSTISGFLQLGLALPIGLLSDRIGRPGLIMAGISALILGMLIMAGSTSTALLVLSLVLNGLGGIAVFQIGHAHLGDITTPVQRPLGFGLITTAMALGFGLGPYCGGIIIDHYNYRAAYLTGAAIGLVALLVALTFLRKHSTSGRLTTGGLLAGVRLMTGQPNLRLVAFGNMLIGMTFAGTLSTFLPLYGKELHLTQAAIGSMFAVRAGVSAVGRITSSLFARRVDYLYVMTAALLIIATATFAVGTTTSRGVITAFLSLEGVAYGGFMVAGLTYVANHTTVENRGGAGGVYAMASGFGASVSPWILGIVAEQWGLRAVFFVTGATLSVGVLIFAFGLLSLRAAKCAPSGNEVMTIGV